LPFVNLTGGVRVMLDYANWLHDAGHDITVVYPCWPYRFQYTRRQQWTEFGKHRRQKSVPWFDLRCPLTRVPLVRGRFLPAADLVIATAWPTVHDVARLPERCGRKVHIVMHHESGTGKEHRVQGIYRYPLYRIAFSRFVERTMTEQFGCRIDEVVPNGIDQSLFFPDGETEPNTVLLLYHPDGRKGAADGIAALVGLRQRVPGQGLRHRAAAHNLTRLDGLRVPSNRPGAAPALLDVDRPPLPEPVRGVRPSTTRSDGMRVPRRDDRGRGCSGVRGPRSRRTHRPPRRRRGHDQSPGGSPA
ncbi:MAG: hypothetical protein EHM13_02300, partial [Acidobacteria bacterium]